MDTLKGIGILAAVLVFGWLAFGGCDTDCSTIDDPYDQEACYEAEREARDQPPF